MSTSETSVERYAPMTMKEMAAGIEDGSVADLCLEADAKGEGYHLTGFCSLARDLVPAHPCILVTRARRHKVMRCIDRAHAMMLVLGAEIFGVATSAAGVAAKRDKSHLRRKTKHRTERRRRARTDSVIFYEAVKRTKPGLPVEGLDFWLRRKYDEDLGLTHIDWRVQASFIVWLTHPEVQAVVLGTSERVMHSAAYMFFRMYGPFSSVEEAKKVFCRWPVLLDNAEFLHGMKDELRLYKSPSYSDQQLRKPRIAARAKNLRKYVDKC